MNLWSVSRWAAAVIVLAALFQACHAGAALWQGMTDNTRISELVAGRDIAVEGGAAAPVLAARARLAIAKGNIDEARSIADHMTAPQLAPVRASVLYALGNAHLRQAMQIYLLVPLRQVKPLINAAKLEYRQSLQLDPDNWDCRYNFAISETLMHDPETSKAMSGAQMSHDRASWPDIPGAPNGMP